MSVKILFLMGTMFLASVGYGVILPTLPFLSEEIGASPFELGLALSVFAIASLLMGPVWGSLADRFGRKPILIIGISGYGVFSALLGIAPNIIILIFVRFISGCFVAAIQPSTQALASDYTLPQNRARIFGYLAAMNGLGFIFGPVIGSLLSVFGVAIPFFAVGVLSLINGLMAFWLLPKETKRRNVKKVNFKRLLSPRIPRPSNSMKTMNLGIILPFLIGTFVFSFADAMLATSLAYYITGHLNSTQAVTGLAFAVNGAVGALIQVTILSKLHSRYGEAVTISAGFLIGAVGYFILGLSNVVVLAIMSIVMIGFCRGLAFPTFPASISVRLPKDEMGKGFGFQQTANSLGRAVGPLVAGWAFALEERSPFFLASGTIIVFALSYLAWLRWSKKRRSDYNMGTDTMSERNVN